MRNKNWLRYGFASLILAAGGAGAILVGCTSDDSTDTPVVNADADTTDTGSTTVDEAGTDSSVADSGPQEPGKIILVHGVTDLGPNNGTGFARVCFALGASAEGALVAGLSPQPAVASPGLPWAGIPIGTGGPFGSTGISLDSLVVVPYLMNADALAALGGTNPATKTMTCTDLLKNAVYFPKADAGAPVSDAAAPVDAAVNPDAAPPVVLVEGVHFWRMDPIPAGTVKNNGTFVLTTSGCPADSTKGASCGADFAAVATPGKPGRGNLKISTYALDRTSTVAADEMGAQFIHASPQLQGLAGAVGLPTPGFSTPIVDAGPDSATVDYVPFANYSDGGIAYPQATATALIKAKVNLATTSIAAGGPGTALGAQPGMPLALVNMVSAPEPDAGNDLALGKGFVFVAVGDPLISTTDAGQLDQLKAIHFLGFPINPNVPKLQ